MKKQDLDRIEAKLDKLTDHQSEMNVILAKQAVVLEDHVKRTNLLEQKLEPIEKDINTVKSLAKIVSFLGIGVVMKIIHGLVTGKQ